MIRYLNILFILAVLIGAGTVYDMKLAAKKSAARVAELKQEIEAEQEAIQMLKAEWSMLNQPERLQGLVERYNSYLQLQPLDVRQIVSPDELPTRPVMLEPIHSNDSLGGYAGSATQVR